MDKIKKSLFIPVMYHLALIITLCILQSKPSSAIITTIELLFGAIVTPMFYAVASIVHAILHEGKVYDYIYYSLAGLGIIGLIRLVAFCVFAGEAIIMGVLLALGVFAVSVGIYALWACLFALTDRMMKKRPTRKVNKKK